MESKRIGRLQRSSANKRCRDVAAKADEQTGGNNFMDGDSM